MKSCFSAPLCALLVGAVTLSSALAEDTLVKGRVVGLGADSRTVRVLVEPGNTAVDFYDIDRARIETQGGRVATVATLRQGTPVAVYYTVVNGRWFPQRILIPDANLVVPPAAVISGAEKHALESKAANDGDITTNPGVKARIDRDITTQPGKKDALDNDITKRGN